MRVRGIATTSATPLFEHVRRRARSMRHEPTHAERVLWHLLRNRQVAGLKFRRQTPVGPYFIDFLCHEARLVVELDGPQHGEREQREHDARRSAFLEAEGLAVIRFANEELLSNPERVIEAIQGAATARLRADR